MPRALTLVALVLAALIAVPALASGQSLGKDSKDAVSVSFFGQSMGLLSTNVGDKKFTFNLTRDGPDRDQSFSLDLSGKAANQLGTILKSGSIVAETSAKARYAWRVAQSTFSDDERDRCNAAVRDGTPEGPDRIPAFAACDRAYEARQEGGSWGTWIYVQGGVSGAGFSLLDAAAGFGSQLMDTSFVGESVAVGFNTWSADDGTRTIYGASIGWNQQNSVQAKEMTESVIRDTRVIGTDTTGVVRTNVGKEKTAYEGVYEEFDELAVNADLFSVPKGWSNTGLWFFGRWTMREDRRRLLGGGIGMFFFKDPGPLEPLGSVAIERTRGDWVFSVHGSVSLFFN